MADVQNTFETITRDYVHKIRDYEDSTCYAYVKTQLEHLKSIGEDPTKYEVIFVEDAEPQYIEDDKGVTAKVTKRFRLHKFKD